MVQVYVDSGNSMFNAVAYGSATHPGTQEFIRRQFEAPSNALTDAGQRFVQGARGIYERLSGSTAARVARAARRAIGSLWQSDEVRVLSTIGETQHAPLTMQRWIMAEPFTRKLYHQQRVEGYAGSYTDPFPEDRGEEHYDYRRVMNGIVVEDDDDGWQAVTYLDDLLPDDTELTHEEQVDIIDTWANVVAMIKAGGEDPTSRWNADL